MRSRMGHTVQPTDYTIPASTYKRSPDGATTDCLLLIYLPWKDERLSRPSWLTYSGQFTHISGHPSAAGRAQDMESSPVKDQSSTTAPRNQPSSEFCRLDFYQ